MKKRKTQSGKSIHQKLDAITASLEGMATRDEMKAIEAKMATKDDLKCLEVKLEAKMVSRDHFDRAIRQLVTKVEFDDFKEYVTINMYTKDEHSDFLSMMDPMMLEFRNAERVNKLTGHQLCDMDDKIAGFDKRLKWLERGRILETGNRGGSV